MGEAEVLSELFGSRENYFLRLARLKPDSFAKFFSSGFTKV
jgi:hypothetical protein